MEPAGAFPEHATRLDPRPDLWDSEVRVRLTDVQLDAAGAGWLASLAAGDVGRGRAILLEAVAERGGLPPELADAVAVGRVESRGDAASDVAVGQRVALAPPITAYPLWLHDVSGWHGGPHIPCDGHLIAHAQAAVVTAPATMAAPVLGATIRAAHARAAPERAGTPQHATLVLSGTSAAGALASRAAARLGPTFGTVTSLQEARLLASLGPVEPLVVPVGDLQEAVTSILSAVGQRPRLVVVTAVTEAEARLAGLVVAAGGVVVVTDRHGLAEVVVRAAAGIGCFPRVEVGRTLHAASEIQAAVDEVHDDQILAALMAWRSGSGGPPAATRPVDPEDV